MTSAKLYLFADQTGDVLPSIRELNKLAFQGSDIHNFFRKATHRLKAAIAKVPLDQRRNFPVFEDPLDLAINYKSDHHGPAIASALLSISQIGHLLVYLGSHPTALELSSKPAILGICTGLLAGAAIACCRNITELLAIADDIVVLAFQLGLEAAKRSEYVESSMASWATIVNNVTVEDAQNKLDHFNGGLQLSGPQKVYISAKSASCITVSGPPTITAKLFNSTEVFQNCIKIPLPISAAFHAGHLLPIALNSVLEGLSQVLLDRETRHSLLFSPSTGQQYAGTTFRGLFAEVVNDIMQVPISLDDAVAEISKSITGPSSIVLLGPGNSTNSIRRSLQAHGVQVEVEASTSEAANSSNGTLDAIAIVGISARLPGSETLEELWQVLEQGRDLHEKIRADRFDHTTHCDPSGKLQNSSLTPYGVFVDRPGFFDTRLFNMSPREASQTDPQQRLLLLAAYEALEMAGYAPNRTPSTSTRRIGSFIGQTSDDYREVNASQNIDTYFITGGIRAFGPGRINYHFGWEGPSFSLDTACSSSAASIQLACSSLLARECDTALGGGANFLSASDLFAGLSRGSFLSKTGGCKTFDHDADGYVRADGVGVVVLKRLEDAIADRDNIQAVLRGAVTNHSAEAVSITHPHAATQERLFNAVLNKAGVAAHDVDYAELHGTGTQAGDATESRSVTNVLAKGRSAFNPLYIGTVKPNLGHGEAASGVTSLIKAIMMLRKNMIPPHIGIKGRINQKLPPLAELNTHISFGKTPFFPRANGDGKRRILINNFDAAGGNTSMLLEDPPRLLTNGVDPRGHHIVTVSAKTPQSMVGNCQRLLDFLRDNPSTRLEDLAYTTTARRMHHVLRQSYPVSSISDLIAKLSEDASGQRVWTKSAVSPQVVFVFTGQGSQYAAMASQLYKTHSAFRKTIQDFDAICTLHGFLSFLPIITEDGLEIATTSPVQIQLATVSIELAIVSFWKSLGVYPTAVIGHSLGEYAALCVAGVLSVSTTLYLVGRRASMMLSQCTPSSHSMLASNISAKEVQHMLDTTGLPCEVSCINSPTSTVVSGPADAVRKFQKSLTAQNIKNTVLDVQFAFHSAQLDPVLDDYATAIENVQFFKPTIPIASTLRGIVVESEGTFNAQYLVDQTRRPVQFVEALNALKEKLSLDNRTVWVETGPHPVCLGMLRSTLGNMGRLLPSLKAKQDDWKTISHSVAEVYNAGIDINWSEYHRQYEEALRLLELPNYAFDLKNYWIQYEGDWAIRKGLPQPNTAQLISEPVFKFTPTTNLHRIESESIEKAKITVKFATDAWESKLHHALRGHLVNGAGLCPSTVYADMAFTAARYLQQLSFPDSKLSMDVNTMSVHKPLLIQAITKQIIYITVSRGTTSETDGVEVQFSSQDGDIIQEHANCRVSFGDGEDWKSEWDKTAYLVKARMNQLVEQSREGSVHKIHRTMAYKLFKALVDYDDKYQGMQEVYMDSELLEATAKIQFRTADEDGLFMYSPYHLDGLAHLSGFVLNAAETTPAHSVYISHGWGSMKIVGELSATKNYQNYVRMQETRTRGVMAGDVYVYDGSEVIAVCKDLKFQQIKRSILDHLLPPVPSGSVAPLICLPPVAARRPANRIQLNEPKQTTPSNISDFSKALEIIASEVGVDVSECTDDTNFADLGIDSLLTISIHAKLRDVLSEEVPANFFTDYSTVKDLRVFFSVREVGGPTRGVDEEESEDSDLSTPSTGSRDDGSQESSSSELSSPDETTTLDSSQLLKSIIATEVGVEPEDIEADTVLAELGIDSLLSLSILSAIKTRTGRDLPANFLADYQTFQEFHQAFEPQKFHKRGSAESGQVNSIRMPPAASSVLLQGTRAAGKPSFFLLPDGSGSASSYIGLPSLKFPGAVYGLNSPFLSSPEKFDLALQDVTALYVAEIRRVQPHGPYNLGGWSIGGSYAFEAASQLAQIHGEQVRSLVLIDSPCPKTLPPLPIETIDALEAIGIFDSATSKSNAKAHPAMRKALRAHFAGSVNALKLYKPIAIPKQYSPKAVTVLWAKFGVWETVSEEVRRSTSTAVRDGGNSARDWMMDRRASYQTCGWEELIPAAKIGCKIVEGNHFSIMRKPAIDQVAGHITSILNRV